MCVYVYMCLNFENEDKEGVRRAPKLKLYPNLQNMLETLASQIIIKKGIRKSMILH
jgi:hypothetical protein